MTAEKPSENNNDPTCDETVEVNNAGDEKNSNSNNKNNNNSSNLDNSKEESSKDPSPSPGPLLRRQHTYSGSGNVAPAALGSICWLNMMPSNGDNPAPSSVPSAGSAKAPKSDPNGKDGGATGGGGMSSNGSLSGAASSASISGTDSIDGNNGVGGNDSTANTLQDSLNEKLSKGNRRRRKYFMKPPSATAGFLARTAYKSYSVVRWVLDDFSRGHLVWIKLIFLFQSASMTVLYPYINLHMKYLGISVQEASVINAIIPVLFIFTPPLAGFLADRLGNFRVLLSILTALGGLVALLLLAIPPGRDVARYPDTLHWGIGCGRPDNRARFQKLMLHGFRRDECDVLSASYLNVSFIPGTCGYLCPTRTTVAVKPRFYEYKVIWPNRGGGFGISEIVDVVSLDTDEARLYHEPEVVDNNIFFPMNWTFHLSCDRIRSNDCIFNPIRRAPSRSTYRIQALLSSPADDSSSGGGGGGEAKAYEDGPSFDVASITPPETGRAVTVPVNCGAKDGMANVVSTVETASLPSHTSSRVEEERVDTRFSGCNLRCIVKVPREEVCANTQTGVTHQPAITFWSYLLVRVLLGVLTAASLMMFEGAVMATIHELGGDYGIQRFVGNFGAIVFAPLGGYLIDATSEDPSRPNFSASVYIYLALKLSAAAMLLFIRLDFRPPGERILKNVAQVFKNTEVVVFLVQMMFAGTFWGYIEGFLFWYLDDLHASRFVMGWTVAVGMITSLPFLIFSGPITDLVGHINVIIIGMVAYFVRMIGYSFLQEPVYKYVYPFEALEGLTMALMMTSAVTYVAKISSPQTMASVMGIMGALFFGVGKGSGSLFGGLLMSFIGARNTFRFFAANALACAVAYVIFKCCYGTPREDSVDAARAKKAAAAAAAASVNRNETGNANAGFKADSNGKADKGNGKDAERSQASAGEPQSQSPQQSNGSSGSGPRSLTGGTRV